MKQSSSFRILHHFWLLSSFLITKFWNFPDLGFCSGKVSLEEWVSILGIGLRTLPLKHYLSWQGINFPPEIMILCLCHVIILPRATICDTAGRLWPQVKNKLQQTEADELLKRWRSYFLASNKQQKRKTYKIWRRSIIYKQTFLEVTSDFFMLKHNTQ